MDEIVGTVNSAEFLQAGDDEDREPGTYLTIRLDDKDCAIMAGRVAVRYLGAERK